MKKGVKVLGLFLLGLVMFSLLASVVNALDEVDVRGMFTSTGWGILDFNKTLAQWLFFALITLLVYSIIDLIGLVKQPYVRWPISLVIGFLSVAYIAPSEIMAMLTSYTTLGIMIGMFLPLVIVILFTYAVTRRHESGGLLIQYLMWIGFAGFLLYKTIMLTVFPETLGFVEPSKVLMWLHVGVTIVVVALGLVFNKQLRAWFVGLEIEEMIAAAESGAQKQAAVLTARKKEYAALTGKEY